MSKGYCLSDNYPNANVSQKSLYHPNTKRIVNSLRGKSYDPFVLGDEENEVIVQLFANPFAHTSEWFFKEEFETFQQRHIDHSPEERKIRFEIRPIAPEMRSWTTALAFESKRVRKEFASDEQINATDAAEFFHSIRRHTKSDEFIQVVRRACLVADDDMLTYDRLRIFTEELTDVNPKLVFQEMESGMYLPKVRKDSTLWIQNVTGHHFSDNVVDYTLFINNDPVKEFEGKWALTEQIEAVREIIQLEQQTQ